jgi:alcohol dehydrogenase
MESFKGALAIQSVADPACPRDGAIVAVRACGVCRSDLHAWNGADPDVRLPHVMGHEMAGEVQEVGPACTRFAVGERVTAPFILGCGQCPACRAGAPTICDHQDVMGFTYWGVFAENVAVPHADFNLVRLPDSLSFADAAGMVRPIISTPTTGPSSQPQPCGLGLAGSASRPSASSQGALGRTATTRASTAS